MTIADYFRRSRELREQTGPRPGTIRVPATLEIEAEITTLTDLLDRQTPSRRRLIWGRIDELLDSWLLARAWEQEHERTAP